jgi:hypothetical protein
MSLLIFHFLNGFGVQILNSVSMECCVLGCLSFWSRSCTTLAAFTACTRNWDWERWQSNWKLWQLSVSECDEESGEEEKLDESHFYLV